MSQDKDIIIRQTSWSPFLNRICIITYCNKVRIQLKIADAMTSLTTCSVTKSVVLESHYCWNYKIHPNIRITKTAVMHPIFSVWKHVDSTNPANTVHILIQQGYCESILLYKCRSNTHKNHCYIVKFNRLSSAICYFYKY